MSREFVWRPVTPVPPPSGAIGLTLWTVLGEQSARGYPPGGAESMVLGSDDVGWLRGFIAATPADTDLGADARALLDAVLAHGSILIEVSYE